MEKTEDILITLRDQLREELNLGGQVDDTGLYEMIDRVIQELGEQEYLSLPVRMELRIRLFDGFRRLGILQELVDNPEITEIMVNGKDHIFIETHGSLIRWDGCFESTEQLEDMIQQIVSRINRIVNTSSPVADARLESGERVHVVLPPVALNGPIVTIRKFPEPITIKRLLELGSLNGETVHLLTQLVRSGYNIFICGGTGSGKTTFLNALSGLIPEEERVITIEDSAELQITQITNLVSLETRNANGEGDGAIGIGELIRASLRMRPDRIVVGEVRGSETLDMLQAMLTGHDGSLSTGHGNSCEDMLIRLETMVLMGAELPLAAIRSQIASALDIMIHLGRMRDRSRKVLEITEVIGCVNGEICLSPLYRFEEQEEGRSDGRIGTLKKVGELKHVRKLQSAGNSL